MLPNAVGKYNIYRTKTGNKINTSNKGANKIVKANKIVNNMKSLVSDYLVPNVNIEFKETMVGQRGTLYRSFV